MKKILWVGDGVTPTGFATVNHNIIKHLPQDELEVHHLAINYYGDPHPYEHKIYPATTPQSISVGDLYGYNRLIQMILDIRPDMIFILNDVWVIMKYLNILKNNIKPEAMPQIVVYFPVDGQGYNKQWFKDFDIVDRITVYTEFGKEVVLKADPKLKDKLEVIPHGTDILTFRPLDRETTRRKVFEQVPELWEDAFIVLNVNRNQPRKMLTLSLEAFAKFAAGKPKGVRYYHHAGLLDAGWDIIGVVKSIDKQYLEKGILSKGDMLLEERLLVTNEDPGIQKVSLEELNEIYNTADVGINTSVGEGWGLTATEHAATRVAQIVPNHTACAELFGDCGLTTDIIMTLYDQQTLLLRKYIDSNHLAEQLEMLYADKELRESLAQKGYEKFTAVEYRWETIAQTWKKLFEEVLGETKNE